MELKDKVAIISGASKGIGRAIAEAFAKEGTNVVLAARSEKALRADASDLQARYGIKALPVPVDLIVFEEGGLAHANITSIKELLDKTLEEFGHYDIIVNAAGKASLNAFLSTDVDKMGKEYQTTRALNLDVPFYMMLYGRDQIMENDGVFINISSDAGLEQVVYTDQPEYLASKAGLNHMTRGIDLELNRSASNARAFALAPGNVDTPLLRKLLEKDRPEIGRDIARQVGSLKDFYSRILTPEQVAQYAIDVAKSPERYEAPVIKIGSYEF
jgi:3-oxoacyl-[acyl-carrier protein] reductase